MERCCVCNSEATSVMFDHSLCDAHAIFVRDIELEIRLTPIRDRKPPTKLGPLEWAQELASLARDVARSNMGLCLVSMKCDGVALTATWAAYTPEDYMGQFGEMAKSHGFGLAVHEAAK